MGTQVLLARENAWDYQLRKVDKDGRFEFAGLPNELYTLSANVPKYFLSGKNVSRDPFHGYRLLGTIPRDIEDLRVLLEPGTQPDLPIDQESFAALERRKSSPLQGASTK
jgi:hypothetical protein